MNRLLPLILVLLLLLSGCMEDPPEPSADTDLEPQTTASTAPGLYDPSHPIEQQTQGAVRVYPLNMAGSYGIGFMGSKLLVFSTEDSASTALTQLEGENLSMKANAVLSSSLYPEGMDIRIDDHRVGYYSPMENSILFLDASFHETQRIRVPEDMNGTPVLSEKMDTVFYCTESEIRALSLETGISRLIRRQNCQWLSVDASLFGDTVLKCTVTEKDGDCYTEFISAATGETLGVDRSFLSINTWQQQYLLHRMDGIVPEWLFPNADGEMLRFVPDDAEAEIYSLLSVNSVVTVAADDTAVVLELFDLTDGHMKNRIKIEGMTAAQGLSADPAGNVVWFLTNDPDTGEALLCAWDLTHSSVNDETVYTAFRYTRENPDKEGLARCRALADDLEKRYGVEILLGEEPKEPEDYTFEYEYQPDAFIKALKDLETAFAAFPEEFFTTVAKVSDSGKIQIGLVRDMYSQAMDVPADVTGLQYWVDGEAWIALVAGNNVESTFYHELCHVLDAFVYSRTVIFDEWEKLNPKDVGYDYSYTEYAARTDTTYLEGENRAFIDAYSMTYPKEDRARILEYAITQGNEEYFASETMQNKLQAFCSGVREAFRWEEDERCFLWEQYLTKPFVYPQKW